jgi:bacteriocin biosynthesis cyclodehydratase domain-containing protein
MPVRTENLSERHMSGMSLRLKRQYSIVAHGPDLVELRHGVWNPESHVLRDDSSSGRLHRIIRRLDGSASPSEIARVERVPLEDVEELIDYLGGLDLLESTAASAFDHHLDALVPWRRDEDTDLRSVMLVGDTELTGPIGAHLGACLPDIDVVHPVADDPAWSAVKDSSAADLNDGLAFEQALDTASSWRGSLLVHATHVVDPVMARVLNRLCIGLAVPWLHAALDGPFLLVGPLMVPARSACYECLETRVVMNMRQRAEYLRYKDAIAELRVTRGTLPVQSVVTAMLASHAALEALNYLTTGSTFTFNKILAIYLPTMEFAYNEVLRVPGCRACGAVADRDHTGLYFDTAALFGERAGA